VKLTAPGTGKKGLRMIGRTVSMSTSPVARQDSGRFSAGARARTFGSAAISPVRSLLLCIEGIASMMGRCASVLPYDTFWPRSIVRQYLTRSGGRWHTIHMWGIPVARCAGQGEWGVRAARVLRYAGWFLGLQGVQSSLLCPPAVLPRRHGEHGLRGVDCSPLPDGVRSAGRMSG